MDLPPDLGAHHLAEQKARGSRLLFEKEENNTLNFLELTIIENSNGSLITNQFIKPTWSGCYLNYEPDHLFSQKIGLIKGLVARCIKLSDIKYKNKNLDEIKVILQLNSYPLMLIESVINP